MFCTISESYVLIFTKALNQLRMKFRIEFVDTASKGAPGKLKKTANLKLVIHKTGYNRESKSLRNSVKIEEWDKNKERVKSSSTNAGVLINYPNYE